MSKSLFNHDDLKVATKEKEFNEFYTEVLIYLIYFFLIEHVIYIT